METKVITPEGYQKVELPYFNEWIAALESGKYMQTRETLCSGGKYCCLGVLSKVQGRLSAAGYDGLSINVLNDDNPCFPQLNSHGQFPLGVKVITPQGSTLYMLTSCNDAGLPFEEIANIIKQIWKPKATN
jgi:hypothetical protein